MSATTDHVPVLTGFLGTGKATRLKRILIGFVLALLWTNPLHAGPVYSFAFIDAPGASRTLGWRVNDVGRFSGASVGPGAFLLDLSTNQFTFINVPNPAGGVFFTGVPAVSNLGQAAGFYRDAKNRTHGYFRSSGGQYTTLDFPGATRTGGTDVNDLGVVVGSYTEVGGIVRGYRFDGLGFTPFEVPGARFTQPNDINNFGTTAGYYRDALGAQHGFLRDASGNFSLFDVPFGAPNLIEVNGLNDLGHVVGYAGANQGFVRIGSEFHPFAAPGAVITFPTGINNAGQIAGFGSLDGVTTRAFLATPVPEPSSLVLLGAALCGPGAPARWRSLTRRTAPDRRSRTSR
jgi:hypothetical protein